MALRISTLLVSLLTMVSVAGAAAPATAATPTGSVTGRVVDSAGHGLPDFGLRLVSAHENGPRHTYSTTTDASGSFRFATIAADRYLTTGIDEGHTWFRADPSSATSITVGAGTRVTVPTVTMLRAATVRGTVVSSTDGSPITGAGVSADGPGTTTSADGSFSFAIRPRPVVVRVWHGPDAVQAAVRVFPGEGATVDLGTVAAHLVGTATANVSFATGGIVGRDGLPFLSAVVDGCRVTSGLAWSCSGVGVGSVPGSLDLQPGRHTIRYELRNPVTSAVRTVTRTAEILLGQETAADVVFPIVDPASRITVGYDAYRRGHPIVLHVREGRYLDGGTPHLPVTIRVNGHAVKATSMTRATRADGVDVLRATLPTRWSASASVKVRVVLHSEGAYAGQTAETITPHRSG